MVTFAEQLYTNVPPGNEFLNAGSILLVTNLPTNASKEPQVHTLSSDAALLDDEELTLTSDQLPGGTFLRQGTVLHFPTTTAVVTEDITVTTSTVVPVEPLTGAIALNDEAQTWALLKLLSPMNLPFNIENQTVDRTDLNTIDGSTVKTKRDFKPQTSTVARPDDKALWEVIYPAAAAGNVNIFVHMIRTSGLHAFGIAQIDGYNSDGNTAEIDKPQFTISYQGIKGLPAPWAYLDAAKQVVLNNVVKLSGLNIYS